VSRPAAGTIVLVAWRVGPVPRESNEIRAAVVVEDEGLFPDAYPNTIVVPLTRDEALAYAAFAERIDPTPENGADAATWALAHHVTTVSLRRVKGTRMRITTDQLTNVRRRIALAVGSGV
jgi:mRNA interferase MazF